MTLQQLKESEIDKTLLLEGAKLMLEWIDNSMESKSSASRIYFNQTFQIREMLKYLNNENNLIYK